MGRRLILTDGDVEVFHWLWMLRVMTLEQIRRVRYYQAETGHLSSLDNVRKRLKRLWDAGYLKGTRLLETNERVYFLDQKALAPLRESFGVEQQRLYQPRGFDTMQHLLHPILVTECAVRVLESIRGTSMRLLDLPPHGVPFYQTHAVADPSAKKHIRRFVTQDDIAVPGEAAPLRIRPDLVFALAEGEGSRLFFLEADRDTESAKEIARKLLGYAAYETAQDPSEPDRFRWQRYGPIRDYRVLLLTTSQRRVERLVRYLQDKPGFHLLALTSLEAVRDKNMVFGEVWSTANGESRALALRIDENA